MKCTFKHYLLLLFFAMQAFLVTAQQQPVILHFIDKSNNKPLNDVSIFKDGIEVAKTDTTGSVHIPGDIPPQKYLIAFHDGYEPDTLTALTNTTIALFPLTVNLKEATVATTSILRRVLNSSADYVVDYEFVGDNILVAVYSGNYGKKAKLLLLSPGGDTLAITKLKDAPVRLFKSCVGHYYCVCRNEMYMLDIDSHTISLDHAHTPDLLTMLQQCKLCYNNKLYYNIADNKNEFSHVFGFVKSGDTVLHPFFKIDGEAVKLASERSKALAMSPDWGRPMLLTNILLNRGYLKAAGDALYAFNDSIVFFDFDKKQIYLFDTAGQQSPVVAFAFNCRQLSNTDIIKDDAAGIFYLYRHYQGKETLEVLNIHTGNISTIKIDLEKPFAENIKIHKGNIYFLWQDAHSNATRLLFAQKGILFADNK